MKKCWETAIDKRFCTTCPAFLKQIPCWTIKQSLCVVGCQDTNCYDCSFFNSTLSRLAPPS